MNVRGPFDENMDPHVSANDEAQGHNVGYYKERVRVDVVPVVTLNPNNEAILEAFSQTVDVEAQMHVGDEGEENRDRPSDTNG